MVIVEISALRIFDRNFLPALKITKSVFFLI
jgi:hypothetical protein